jgi:hypothetical protein
VAIPRLVFDLSILSALPLDCAVLPLISVYNFNRPPLDSNLLEYHPGASRAHNATAAYVQVEEVLLQATPEGLKFFQDNQCQDRELCCREHTFVVPIPT